MKKRSCRMGIAFVSALLMAFGMSVGTPVECVPLGMAVSAEESISKTLYMEDGSIIITATGYSQGDSEENAYMGEYIISQRNSEIISENNIDISSGTHEVTLDGINISGTIYICPDNSNDECIVTLKGTDKENNISSASYSAIDSSYADALSFEDIIINLNVANDGSSDNAISASVLNINSGKICLSKPNGDYALECDTLNINDGELAIVSTGSWYDANVPEININGGIFKSASEHDLWVRMGGENAKVIISGGSVYGGENGITFFDIYYHPSIIIKGGSAKLCEESDIMDKTYITNSCGDNLECIVYDTFPTEEQRTFVNSDGTTYIYSLKECDKADDGKYYVWKPICRNVAINETTFPDETFREYVSKKFDTNDDNLLSTEECNAVTNISVSSINKGSVKNLKGIEYFTFLETLACSNNQIISLDISNNSALTSLICDNNQLTNLDVSNNTSLIWLNCYNNNLKSLNTQNNIDLLYLWCDLNQLTELDVSKNKVLTILRCDGNQLTNINVSNNYVLESLYCCNNQLSSLDVSQNTDLTILECYNNHLTTLDLSNNSAITELKCDGNTYAISPTNSKFALSSLNGFDASKASNWSGAVYNKDNNTITITANTVTYTYDCGNGYSVTFTLTVSDNMDISDCINAVNTLYNEGGDVIILNELQMKMIEAVLEYDNA